MLNEAKRLDARQLGRLGVALRHRLDPDAADCLAHDAAAQQWYRLPNTHSAAHSRLTLLICA